MIEPAVIDISEVEEPAIMPMPAPRGRGLQRGSGSRGSSGKPSSESTASTSVTSISFEDAESSSVESEPMEASFDEKMILPYYPDNNYTCSCDDGYYDSEKMCHFCEWN